MPVACRERDRVKDREPKTETERWEGVYSEEREQGGRGDRDVFLQPREME